ncbi:hypothetical protein EH196_19385 [Bacillus sp. C1-1]|nr:hypothetical protein EH196_19385 [Bacillus sp. C1-1]
MCLKFELYLKEINIMDSNIKSINKQRISAKSIRQYSIRRILERNNFSRHQDIVLELKKEGIDTSQPTVQRDLKELGYKKNSSKYFELSYKKQEKYNLDTLYELLDSSKAKKYEKVKTYFIKTEIGKAQEVALLIEKVFKEIVLKTIIEVDSILIFADGKKVSNDFSKLFDD